MIVRFQWLFALVLVVGLTACPTDPPPQNNRAPTAAFTTLEAVQSGIPLAFDASSSSDPDKDVLAFGWDFGDGGRGGSSILAHVFNSAGSFTVGLTATDPSGASSSITKTITVSSRPASGATVSVQGTMRDSSGAVLVGANIELVGGTGTNLSDAAGKVTLSLATGTPNTLRITKTGYAEQYKILELPLTASSGFFEVLLSKRAPDQTLDAGAGGSLSSTEGAKLTLPAGTLVDAAGKPVSGSVNVNLTSVDVTDSAKLALFPGAFSGILPTGSSSPIVSFGTTEYALSQAGARLQLASGKTASIEIPVFASLNLDGSSLKLGDVLPLWSLDEKTGTWVQEGTGVVVTSSASPSGLALRATVGHFSWWNADIGFDPSNPKPKCVPDQSIPGATNYFANETICNMIAEMDRGLAGTSSQVQPRATPPRLPGYRASTTIPLAGGQALQIPANSNVILRGCALGGTWCGQVTVNKASGSSDEVIIKLRPVDVSAISVAITSPTGTAYAGSSITFQAVLNSGLLPDKLEFFKDNTSIGVAANSSLAWSTNSVPEGSYTITAKATVGAVTVSSAPLTVIVDHGFPSLVSRIPVPAGIGSPSTPIQAIFSEPMLSSSLTDASMVLKVNDVVVGRSLTLSSDGRTLTITPSSALPVPANANVSLSSGITDLARNPLIAAVNLWNWTSSVWSPVGTPVEGAQKISNPVPRMTLGTDGQPFVAFAAAVDPTSPFGISDLYVRRFDGSSWLNVGTHLSAVTGPGVFGYDQSNVACSAIAVDASSNPTVVWQELTDDQQTTYAYYVRRYNPTTAAWEAIGANGGKLPDTAYNACSMLSLKVDSLGRPVVAYIAKSGFLIKRFDGTNWVGLGPNDGNLGSLGFQGFNVVLAATDNPVLIGNEQNGFAVVKRFNSVSSLWENVGPYGGKLRAAGLMLGTPTLILDGSDNPLVAGTVSVPYGSGVTSSDITVFRFTGTDWQELGARAVNYGVDVGQIATVAFDQDANPVLAYVGSTADSYGLYVKRFNGSSWVGVGTSTGKVGVAAIGSLSLQFKAGKLTLAFQVIPVTISVLRFP